MSPLLSLTSYSSETDNSPMIIKIRGVPEIKAKAVNNEETDNYNMLWIPKPFLIYIA